MITDFPTRVRRFYICAFPAFITLLLVLVVAINLQFSGLANFFPLFAFMAVFYWGIYQPELVPIWFVFLLGLFQDFLYQAVPGISSFLLILFWWIVISQRRFLMKESFFAQWLIFAVSIGLISLVNWLIYSIYFSHAMPPVFAFLQFSISVFFYPLIHKIFYSIYKSFPKMI